MERIGVVSPEQMYALWQDYLTRQQLAPQIRYNFPQRRDIDEVSPHRVKVKNDSGEVIPAFACMRITGVEDVGGQTCITVEKPTSTDGSFLFNSHFAIAVPAGDEQGVGWAFRHGVVTMLGDAPTEPGASYGPIVGSWEIEEGGDKFEVFGRHDFSERALVGRFAGGSGSGNSRWGLVVAVLGCGWYTIELGTLDGHEEASGSGPVCDPCANVTGAGTAGCAITLEYPAPRVVGIGTYVTAYDPASTLIPLRVGTDCVLTKMPGGSAPASGSGSGSTAAGLWAVRGFQEHIVQYKERWDCCDPNGPPVLVGKTPIVFVGKECDEILCDECPASGSG